MSGLNPCDSRWHWHRSMLQLGCSTATGLTNDDVGGEGDPRDGAPDALHQRIVSVPRVPAAHAGQHRAGTALRRHVQLPADVGPPCDDLQIIRRCMRKLLTCLLRATASLLPTVRTQKLGLVPTLQRR